MKRKIFILLFILFLLSGCDAVYNVEIYGNSIKDEFIINNYNIKSWNEGNPSYKNLIDNNYKDFNLVTNKNAPGYPEEYRIIKGYHYYDKELINTTNNYGIKYSYNYNNDNDYAKNPLFTFYNNLKVTNNSNRFIVDTGNPQDCYLFDNYPLMDKLEVNITSEYLVIKNNADEINNNKYTWVITRDNYKNKVIRFEIDKERKANSYLNIDETNRLINIVLVLIGILLIVGTIITFIKVRKSNN